MRNILLFGCLLFSYDLLALPALTPTTSLERTLAYIKTMQADFSETITSGRGHSSQMNQRLWGNFILKKPGKFFWRTKKPIHQDIISDGVHLWFYDKDLEQIMVKSLKENVGTTPASLLNGEAGSISHDYQVKLMPISQNGKVRLYTLTPKRQTLYHYIQMSFDGETLTHMRFEDNLGQFTDFYFSNVKINHPLDDSLFTFKPPKGVDIVNG